MTYFKPNTPFEPELLPPDVNLRATELQEPLLKARVALAELKGYSHLLPNPDLLLTPAILRESIASSDIENVHTTMIEALENQLFPLREQQENDKEVLRYRDTMQYGMDAIKQESVSSRLILDIHRQLLTDSGGQFRTTQNVIVNVSTHEIVYTPPTPDRIPALIDNWIWYINEAGDLDHLLRALIAHYQFEMIHPFDDGNGRTGRILMLLGMVQDALLHWPILYLSGYINQRKQVYYQLLREVSSSGQWIPYLIFMLDAVATQARETQAVLLAIMQLFEQVKQRIQQQLPKIYSRELVELLFSYPIISPVRLGQMLDIHYTTASRHLKLLTEAGLLESWERGKYHFFVNRHLLIILGESL